MTSECETGVTSLCSDLLASLVAAFPEQVTLDYFTLCGLPREAAFASPEARAAFDLVSAFLTILMNEGFGQGDRYTDTGGTYFWSFGLSLTGFDRALAIVGEKPRPLSCQEILRRFCAGRVDGNSTGVLADSRSG